MACLDALDRLDWAACLSAESFGVRLGVRVSDSSLLPDVRRHLPPGFTAADAQRVDVQYSIRGGGPVAGSHVRRFNLVYAGSALCARTLDRQAALEAFETAARFDVAVRAERYTFVHAGVVGVDGRAIVIPGSSTHGKSMLVDALVRAGATYYSDEFAVVDESGLVHPFAKPLTLRLESGGTRRVQAAELGVVSEAPLPVGLIVATQYVAGTEWRPRRLQPGEALLELLAHTVRARLAPAHTMRMLTRVVEGGMSLGGLRGEARAMAADLIGLARSRELCTTRKKAS